MAGKEFKGKTLPQIAGGGCRPHCIYLQDVNPVSVVQETLPGIPACQLIFESPLWTYTAYVLFGGFCLVFVVVVLVKQVTLPSLQDVVSYFVTQTQGSLKPFVLQTCAAEDWAFWKQPGCWRHAQEQSCWKKEAPWAAQEQELHTAEDKQKAFPKLFCKNFWNSYAGPKPISDAASPSETWGVERSQWNVFVRTILSLARSAINSSQLNPSSCLLTCNSVSTVYDIPQSRQGCLTSAGALGTAKEVQYRPKSRKYKPA